jgi:ABC-type glutathione transport system ATPase component
MAAEPAVLLADEPTTALDTVVELSILHLLKQLVKEQGTALLFISHDLAVIQFMAEEVLLIDAGKIVQGGSRSEFFNPAAKAPAQQLLQESTRLNFAIKAAPTEKKATVEAALKVTDLHCDYVVKRNFLGRVEEKFSALRGVDFEVGVGEFVALVGKSGCGKSTLGRCVNGLLQDYRGSIQLNDDRPVAVQTVFQDPSSTLNPAMSCRAVIQEVIKLQQPELSVEQRLARTHDLFTSVGLPIEEYGDRYPEELSGGQRQRVAIARALAAKPTLLICDEAVSALDANLQHEIMELLGRLRRQASLAILFISHDLALVAKHADRIAVMEAGKIVEISYPHQLFQADKHPATQELLLAARLS